MESMQSCRVETEFRVAVITEMDTDGLVDMDKLFYVTSLKNSLSEAYF